MGAAFGLHIWLGFVDSDYVGDSLRLSYIRECEVLEMGIWEMLVCCNLFGGWFVVVGGEFEV